MELEDLINKTCLIGLSYFDIDGEQIKQSQLSGVVVAVDEEDGISVQLEKNNDKAIFILPPSLKAWFIAPAGHYKNAECNLDIENPDYFVTWDVVKKKDDTEEGQQEWWEWHPQSQAPRVN